MSGSKSHPRTSTKSDNKSDSKSSSKSAPKADAKEPSTERSSSSKKPREVKDPLSGKAVPSSKPTAAKKARKPKKPTVEEKVLDIKKLTQEDKAMLKNLVNLSDNCLTIMEAAGMGPKQGKNGQKTVACNILYTYAQSYRKILNHVNTKVPDHMPYYFEFYLKYRSSILQSHKQPDWMDPKDSKEAKETKDSKDSKSSKSKSVPEERKKPPQIHFRHDRPEVAKRNYILPVAICYSEAATLRDKIDKKSYDNENKRIKAQGHLNYQLANLLQYWLLMVIIDAVVLNDAEHPDLGKLKTLAEFFRGQTYLKPVDSDDSSESSDESDNSGQERLNSFASKISNGKAKKLPGGVLTDLVGDFLGGDENGNGGIESIQSVMQDLSAKSKKGEKVNTKELLQETVSAAEPFFEKIIGRVQSLAQDMEGGDDDSSSGSGSDDSSSGSDDSSSGTDSTE
jgi:hypothetical protein